MGGQLDRAAASGEIVDLQQLLLDLTTRLMGRIAYDVRTILPILKNFTEQEVHRLEIIADCSQLQ